MIAPQKDPVQPMHEDLFMEVLKYLDIQSQMNMWEVSMTARQHLPFIWRRQFKAIYLNHAEPILEPYHLSVLLENICDTLELLSVKFMEAELYEVITQFVYPKVQHLEFSILMSFSLEDTDLPKLCQCFPNVVVFKPHGEFTGKDMWSMEKVQDLNLQNCHIKFRNLEMILERLNLRKLHLNCFKIVAGLRGAAIKKFCRLEQLTLASTELPLLNVSVLRQMTRLRELIICDGAETGNVMDFCERLFVYRRNDLLGIEWVGLPPLDILEFTILRNLHQLAFARDSASLLRLPNTMRNCPVLRELSFKSCEINNGEVIMDILREGIQLNRLDIIDCHFEVPKVVIDIEDIMKNRFQPLIINFCDNTQMGVTWAATPVELAAEGESKYVTFSSEPLKTSYDNAIRFIMATVDTNDADDAADDPTDDSTDDSADNTLNNDDADDEEE